MITLNYSSSVVKQVFSAVEEFDSNGSYPEILENDFFIILPCVLELQIDSFIEFLLPNIGQFLTKLDDRTINMIPRDLIPRVVSLIPIDSLDPDFIISHFGFDLLYEKVQISEYKGDSLDTFLRINEYEETCPESIAANTLYSIKHSFSNSEFVRQNLTVIDTKTIDNYKIFPKLKYLKVRNAELENSLLDILNDSLIRLEICSTRLKLYHVVELLSFLENSNIEFLSLRDDRIGQAGCKKLTEYLRTHQSTNLHYFDIGSNSIGADEISNFIAAASHTTLKGIAIDGNFFRPSSNELTKLQLIKMPFISARALHWDEATAVVIREVIEQDCIQWVDLSAQVIHQNSDPDLSGSMAEFVLSKASPSISTLIFANHRLDHMNFSCIARMNLTTLNLANSNLDSSEIEAMTTLVMRLESVDLSSNNMFFKTNAFLIACAESKTLKFLSLTDNNIGDVSISRFFDDLRENQSNITTLRLSNCGLNKRSSKSLVELLSTGKMRFKELDISNNSMFHVFQGIQAANKTPIERLLVDGNSPNYEPFVEFLERVESLKFICIDKMKASIIKKIAPYIKGVRTISMSYTNFTQCDDIIEIINQSQCHCVWAINSIPIRKFPLLMSRWREMPSLLKIHVEDNLKPNKAGKIPIFFEDRRK